MKELIKRIKMFFKRFEKTRLLQCKDVAEAKTTLGQNKLTVDIFHFKSGAVSITVRHKNMSVMIQEFLDYQKTDIEYFSDVIRIRDWFKMRGCKKISISPRDELKFKDKIKIWFIINWYLLQDWRK